MFEDAQQHLHANNPAHSDAPVVPKRRVKIYKCVEDRETGTLGTIAH